MAKADAVLKILHDQNVMPTATDDVGIGNIKEAVTKVTTATDMEAVHALRAEAKTWTSRWPFISPRPSLLLAEMTVGSTYLWLSCS